MRKLIIITLCLTTFPVLADVKSDLLALSDQQLFDAASAGQVGHCKILDAKSLPFSCDFYAYTDKVWSPVNPYQGLPGVDQKPFGSGCVYISSGNPKGNTCWDDGYPGGNNYPQYNSTSTPICVENNHIKNAANMIRIALNTATDPCDIASIVPPAPVGKRLTQLVKEGKIVFGNVLQGSAAGDCSKVSEKGTMVNGQMVYAQRELPEATCRRLRDYAQKLYGNTQLPKGDPLAYSLGLVTPQQFQTIVGKCYLDVNRSVLAKIDTLNRSITPSMTSEQKLAVKDQIQLLVPDLRVCTQAETQAMIDLYVSQNGG